MSAGKVALNYLILRLIFCILLSPTLMIFILAVTCTLQGAGKNYTKPLSYVQEKKLIDKYCERNGCTAREKIQYQRYGISFVQNRRKNGLDTP